MEYIVGNSTIQDRDAAIDAAIDWWASACGIQDVGDPADWDEDEVRDYLPGWCRVRIAPGEALKDSAEQEKLDNDLIERALEKIRAARKMPPRPGFYLVRNGKVSRATPDTPWDGEESVLVYATSPRAALIIAEAYDKGLAQADNVFVDGKTVAAVFMINKDSFV